MAEDLFDPQPKDDPKALYGREKELADLTKHLEEGRWVVLLGPRRIGKTSLAKCAVAKLGYDSVVADARQDSDLAHALVSSLASTKKADASISAGIQLPAHIPLSAGAAYSGSFFAQTLDQLLNEKRRKRVVVLLDEAQWFKNPRGVVRLLAHIYDYHYRKATLVITGSAVGVMRSITEPDAKSALFGRAITTMEIGRWSPSVSLGFLEKGCGEKKIPYNEAPMSRVVDEIGGTPGWLTLFGYVYGTSRLPTRERIEDALERTKREGMKILKEELASVSRLAAGWERQLKLLRQLASGGKRFTELAVLSGLPNQVLSRHLAMLQRLRYVEKNEYDRYVITDPILKEFLAQPTPK